ncbi:MAG: sugar transporter substrate-binding protein [Anaerocolumna sp.]|jgi:raffinose/stachyose/melibiose transport system substrate-binding protein|nr:sugar transporter substrate-binding protein [Anaerocolumna sp.]
MKRKLLGILLCIALLSTVLVGCQKENTGNDTNNPTPTKTQTGDGDTTSDKPVDIYMFISSPEYADAINTLIAAYKEVKPNVTINYETTQNDYPTLLKAKINSGEMPDIFSSTSGKEIGVYLDYSKDLSDQPLADAMSDPVKEVMKANGDEVHGLSIKGNFFGLVYNKAAFEKAGIAAFPQTTAELKTACEKLKTAGYTPFTTGYAEWWVYKHVFQHFLNAAQPDDVAGLVNSFIQGKAKIKDYPALYNDFFNYIDLTVQYGDKKPLETDLSAEIAAFGSGQAAIMNGQGAWVEADILKLDPEIQIGFDGYPVNDDATATKVISGSDQALRVNKDSKVLDEVLAFLNWWYTSDYGKSWFSDVAGVIPPIKDATTPDYEIIKQGTLHVEQEGSGALAVVYSTDSFHQAFGEIMQAYIAGTISKDEACTQIETKWVELEAQ